MLGLEGGPRALSRDRLEELARLYPDEMGETR
jgi:hypothetical protein